MIKLKIGQKLLLPMLGVSLIPLVVVTAYWYYSAQSSLKSQAIDQQKILTNSAVYRVNQYLTDKINSLIIHSQSPAVQQLDATNSKIDLESLINQDSDITKLILANSNGVVTVALGRSNSLPTGYNISNQDAFKAATYLAGRQYISQVSTNSSGQNFVTIAVPLVIFSSGQNLNNLTTAAPTQIRTPQEIKGVLIETDNISSLWQNVLANTSSNGGYEYVVNSLGTLVAYPSSNFIKHHSNLSSSQPVAAFIQHPSSQTSPTVMTSEQGIPVLSSYGEVAQTNWGVITIEPLSNIFAISQHLVLVGIILFIIASLLILIIAYVASRQITTPIKNLALAATRISRGDLKVRLKNTSNDELGALSESFNLMVGNIEALLQSTRSESAKANVILNNVSEGIIAVDDAGVIILVNNSASELTNDMPLSITGSKFFDIFHMSLDDSVFTPKLDEIKIYQDITLTNSNKRTYLVDVLINPIQNDPLGIKSIITILDRTKEQELENMKVDFVSMAAHELRTPLTSIRGYLDLISRDDKFKLPEDLQLYFKRIRISSEQLVGLINNILNVSKIEHGELTQNSAKIDWAELVNKAVQDQMFTATEKSISLAYSGPDQNVFVIGDQISLLEVISNLITNAIHYTREFGNITVSITQTDNEVITSVKDNGVGIPADQISHLFTKFFRIHSGLASGSGGTGLGLYISKSIVDLHGGSIGVVSEESKGSTFTIRLPSFNEQKYNEISKLKSEVIKQNHGWITKNINR